MSIKTRGDLKFRKKIFNLVIVIVITKSRNERGNLNQKSSVPFKGKVVRVKRVPKGLNPLVNKSSALIVPLLFTSLSPKGGT